MFESGSRHMSGPGSTQRLAEAADLARTAEARGEDDVAGEAWRRYRLIRDATRDAVPLAGLRDASSPDSH
jgi:hypothetical protein